MTTQIEHARKGLITPQMETVAAAEDVSTEYVRTMVAEGKIVIPWNTLRQPKAVGVGKGLRTKVNASIGTSSDIIDIDMEIEKARIAEAKSAAQGEDVEQIKAATEVLSLAVQKIGASVYEQAQATPEGEAGSDPNPNPNPDTDTDTDADAGPEVIDGEVKE